MSKQQDMLELLGKLDKKSPAKSIPGITHLNEPSVYIFSEENILFIVQAGETFVKKDNEPVLFHANSSSHTPGTF